jgi:hypothetical protein
MFLVLLSISLETFVFLFFSFNRKSEFVPTPTLYNIADEWKHYCHAEKVQVQRGGEVWDSRHLAIFGFTIQLFFLEINRKKGYADLTRKQHFSSLICHKVYHNNYM